jgi:hypothetical protein
LQLGGSLLHKRSGIMRQLHVGVEPLPYQQVVGAALPGHGELVGSFYALLYDVAVFALVALLARLGVEQLLWRDGLHVDVQVNAV